MGETLNFLQKYFYSQLLDTYIHIPMDFSLLVFQYHLCKETIWHEIVKSATQTHNDSSC